MKIYVNRTIVKATAAVLLLLSSVTSLNSIQAQEGSGLREQVSSSDGSGQLVDQGRIRTYSLHTPKSYRANRPMPLLLAFHGSGGTGNSIASVTHFNDLADKNGFIVVYPDGIDHHWNYASSGLPIKVQVDDVSFVAALIQQLKLLRNIDTHRIYATGFSSGGILTQALGCQLPKEIAAFASVAGSLPVNLASNCKPKSPVSVLMIHGTGDRSVPYTGGKIGGSGREVVSVPKTVELWRQRNGCAKTPEDNSGSQVEVARYSSCRDGAEVMLVTVKRGGHSWPGSTSNTRAYQGNAINASQTIWSFFQRHQIANSHHRVGQASSLPLNKS